MIMLLIERRKKEKNPEHSRLHTAGKIKMLKWRTLKTGKAEKSWLDAKTDAIVRSLV